MVRAMVHSIKHYVQNSLETVAGGTVVTKQLIKSVERGTATSVSQVEEGNTVKAVYVESWIRGGEATAGSGQYIIYKASADTSNPTATDMAALGDWDNKKNIFYTTMGLFNDNDADATVVYKGWLKIPKGKQRFGLGDVLKIAIFTPTIDLHHCGFATYKEYS